MSPTADPEVLRSLAIRIDAAPSVSRRSGGLVGTVASYLPGERIHGLRVTDDGRLEVHVVMRWGNTVNQVEQDVLTAVGDRWHPTAIDLVIDDVDIAALTADHHGAHALDRRPPRDGIAAQVTMADD